jgi:hypothetical protein
MLMRSSLGPGRARYRVHRPQWPTTVVSELAYVAGTSIGGAGMITLVLHWLGVV